MRGFAVRSVIELNFNPDILVEMRETLKDKIKKIEVLIEDEWHSGDIRSLEITDDTVILKATFGDLNDKAFTMLACRLTDAEGNVIAQHDQLYRKIINNGTFISVSLTIKEV